MRMADAHGHVLHDKLGFNVGQAIVIRTLEPWWLDCRA